MHQTNSYYKVGHFSEWIGKNEKSNDRKIHVSKCQTHYWVLIFAKENINFVFNCKILKNDVKIIK